MSYLPVVRIPPWPYVAKKRLAGYDLICASIPASLIIAWICTATSRRVAFSTLYEICSESGCPFFCTIPLGPGVQPASARSCFAFATSCGYLVTFGSYAHDHGG